MVEKALVALPEDLCSFPGPMVLQTCHNSSSRGPYAPFWLYTDMHAGKNTFTYKIQMELVV